MLVMNANPVKFFRPGDRVIVAKYGEGGRLTEQAARILFIEHDAVTTLAEWQWRGVWVARWLLVAGLGFALSVVATYTPRADVIPLYLSTIFNAWGVYDAFISDTSEAWSGRLSWR